MKTTHDYDIDAKLLARVHCEYADMPGLQLTLAQGARLWNIDRDTCAQVLETLVEASYLRKIDGCYVRADCGRLCA